MYHTKLTAVDMRHELARVCDKIDRRDCGKPCCPLYDLCAALGNPRTTKAEYVKAMYLIYKHRQNHKVKNRIAIASGAAIMITAGLFPVFGALIATLPSSVLGGCTIIMFANIIVSGLDMFGRCGLTKRNLVVLDFSLSFGMGFTQVPGIFDVFPDIVKTVFAENCVAVVFVTAIILDRVLPVEKEAV